jgi:uncharacterized protein (TIGR02246 family)
MSDPALDELAAAEDRFNRAMIANDVAAIAACVADDWVLVTPEAGPVSRERILHVIGCGELTHETMTKDPVRVQLLGDVAIVTARGRNTGTWRGQPMAADEWVTDVYRRIDGDWRCVLTHLTPAQR